MISFTYAEVILGTLAGGPHFGLCPVGIAVEFAIVHALDAHSGRPLVSQQRVVLGYNGR